MLGEFEKKKKKIKKKHMEEHRKMKEQNLEIKHYSRSVGDQLETRLLEAI